MPGLVILHDPHARPESAARFKAMHQASRLQGWYQLDAWSEPAGRLHLGRADLGVFNRAPQPLLSPDGRYRVCLQGEFYDRPARFAALAARGHGAPGRDNADLLLATYLADGLAGIAALNGSFFFAIWDAERETLMLGSDRHASRPHLYAFAGDRFLLAPEVSGLFAGLGERPAYDRRGLAEFLALEYPLADRTVFDGVRSFPGGTFLALGPEGPRWTTYWRPVYTGGVEARPRAEGEWLEEATHRYRTAVGRTLDGPVVVPLSGGTDSRTVVAFRGESHFPVFTFGAEGTPDVIYARQVAAAAGLPHHFLPLREDYLAHHAEDVVRWGDGMISAFHAHDADGLEEARAIAPIAVYGMTAEFGRLEAIDALLAEDPRTKAHRLALLARHIRGGRRPLAHFADDEALVDRLVSRWWIALPPALAREVLAPGFAAEMAGYVRQGLAEALAGITAEAVEDRAMLINLTQRQRRFTQWGLKVAGVMLESRKPFDDYELVDFLLTVPAATRRRLVTQVLCAASPELAAIPRTGYFAPVSATPAQRALAYAGKTLRQTLRPARVQSFADPQAGLRTHARAAYDALFADTAAWPRELVDLEAARRLWGRHLAGEVDAASAVCALATIALTERIFGGGLSRAA